MKPNPNDRREQPRRDESQQQQQQQQSSGGQQQQEAASGAGGQYGEGNYKATRDYDRGVKEHLRDHDVEREARDAAPRSEAEAKEMDDAEAKGRSRAKGPDDDMPDKPEDPGERVK